MPRGCPKQAVAAQTQTEDELTDVVVLSVKLRSGRFETSLQVPLYAGVEAKQEALDQWFEMIQFAFKTGVQEAKVVFEKGKRP